MQATGGTPLVEMGCTFCQIAAKVKLCAVSHSYVFIVKSWVSTEKVGRDPDGQIPLPQGFIEGGRGVRWGAAVREALTLGQGCSTGSGCRLQQNPGSCGAPDSAGTEVHGVPRLF